MDIKAFWLGDIHLEQLAGHPCDPGLGAYQGGGVLTLCSSYAFYTQPPQIAPEVMSLVAHDTLIALPMASAIIKTTDDISWADATNVPAGQPGCYRVHILTVSSM